MPTSMAAAHSKPDCSVLIAGGVATQRYIMGMFQTPLLCVGTVYLNNPAGMVINRTNDSDIHDEDSSIS